MTHSWNPDFAAHSPAFVPLHEHVLALRGGAFPDCEDLNRLLTQRNVPVTNADGLPLRFVVQEERLAAFEDGYEPRIFLRGEVQLRAGNWHDLFNALVWLAFPLTKAALNARHFHALARQRTDGPRNRNRLQDALTLFDEGGVIVATSNPALYELLAGHCWNELFWRRRAEVDQNMRFYLFGHGLFEKMLHPFIGVTGRGIACTVAADFFALPLARQLDELDKEVAARIADKARDIAAREFTAVPLLGIPGWCPDNARENYYANTAYFRPARKATTPRRRGSPGA